MEVNLVTIHVRHVTVQGGNVMSVEVHDYTNNEMLSKINDLIHSARDRELMKYRLIDGFTQEQLAEEFDLSVRQVQRIIYKYQKLLLL